jgi:hypothetical protein
MILVKTLELLNMIFIELSIKRRIGTYNLDTNSISLPILIIELP